MFGELYVRRMLQIQLLTTDHCYLILRTIYFDLNIEKVSRNTARSYAAAAKTWVLWLWLLIGWIGGWLLSFLCFVSAATTTAKTAHFVLHFSNEIETTSGWRKNNRQAWTSQGSKAAGSFGPSSTSGPHEKWSGWNRCRNSHTVCWTRQESSMRKERKRDNGTRRCDRHPPHTDNLVKWDIHFHISNPKSQPTIRRKIHRPHRIIPKPSHRYQITNRHRDHSSMCTNRHSCHKQQNKNCLQNKKPSLETCLLLG
mmetsp:Transcript_16860/g.30603  ORF Transcript_16860/g.30603 Transcript_16860/m.30603 type:complete len:254 (+) Transcript_16860:44-805(+)